MAQPAYVRNSTLANPTFDNVFTDIVCNNLDCNNLQCQGMTMNECDALEVRTDILDNLSGQPNITVLTSLDVSGTISANQNITTTANMSCQTLTYTALSPAIPQSPVILLKGNGTSPSRFVTIGGASIFNFTNYFEFEINLYWRIISSSADRPLILALSIDNGSSFPTSGVEFVAHTQDVATNNWYLSSRFGNATNFGDGFSLTEISPENWTGNVKLRLTQSGPVGWSVCSYVAYYNKAGIGAALTEGSFSQINGTPNVFRFGVPTAGNIQFSYNVIGYPI